MSFNCFGFKNLLKWLLVPVVAFLAGAGSMLYGIMRAGYLQ
jgi:hypothetical protein